MAGSIRKRAVTVAVAAGLVGSLVACGPIDRGNDGTAASVALEVTSTPAVTAKPSPSSTATPSAAQPTPTTPKTSTPTLTVPKTTTPAPTTPIAPSPKPGATDTPKPKPSASATTTPKPKSPTPTPNKPSDTEPVRTDLRFGDRGAKVLTLQKRLSDLGYWLGEPDGHYGFLTQQAVWALQKSAGLSRDGLVGTATQKALTNGARPQTRLQGNGIEIDLQRQILMIVRGGQVRYTLNTSTGGGYEYESRSGGVAVANTPKGTFRVGHVVDGMDKARLGDLWRPRYFNGGIAVHGSPSIPTHPASHGCARVSNASMDMIWTQDLMPKGSTVIVR